MGMGLVIRMLPSASDSKQEVTPVPMVVGVVILLFNITFWIGEVHFVLIFLAMVL